MVVDTTEFSIPIREENIKDWSRFHIQRAGAYLSSPVTMDYANKVSFIKLVQNPRVSDKEKGTYTPLINLHKRDYRWTLQPDGSMCRFLLETNLLEYEDRKYEYSVQKYYDFFADNGFIIDKNDIREAIVRKADISKILLLPPGIPLLPLFEIMKKHDFGANTEVHDKEYKEYKDLTLGGVGNCLTWALGKKKPKKVASIYEKEPQFRQNTDKTFMEKNQVSFLDKHAGRTYQSIKFEECLFEKKRVDYMCNKATGEERKFYTYTDFWNGSLKKAILMERGSKLFQGADLNMLLLGSLTPNEIDTYLKASNPEMQSTTIESIGFRALQAKTHGIKEMKKILIKQFSRSTFQKRLKKIREISANIKKLPLKEVYDNLFQQLKNPQPILSNEDLLVNTNLFPIEKAGLYLQRTLPFLHS